MSATVKSELDRCEIRKIYNNETNIYAVLVSVIGRKKINIEVEKIMVKQSVMKCFPLVDYLCSE